MTCSKTCIQQNMVWVAIVICLQDRTKYSDEVMAVNCWRWIFSCFMHVFQEDRFQKDHAMCNYSCLTVFAWRRVVLRFFDPKQLLRVSCILWCYYPKCFSINQSTLPWTKIFNEENENVISLWCSFYHKSQSQDKFNEFEIPRHLLKIPTISSKLLKW